MILYKHIICVQEHHLYFKYWGQQMDDVNLLYYTQMIAVAVDWANSVEVDMLKYMSADADTKILRHYETLITTNQPKWEQNPLEDKVQGHVETPLKNMNSNQRRKENGTMINNPYRKTPNATKQTGSPASATYHAHALQAMKVLSYVQDNFDYKLRHEVSDLRVNIAQISTPSALPPQIDEKRLIELIKEHSAEQVASKMDVMVYFSKDELISKIQDKISERQKVTNKLLEIVDQVKKMENKLNDTTEAVGNLASKFANLLTGEQVQQIQTSFQESFSRLEKVVLSMHNQISTSTMTKQEVPHRADTDTQGEKRNSQVREDDMMDTDEEVVIQPIKYPRWQTSVEEIVNTLNLSIALQQISDGNDGQNKSRLKKTVNRNL
jgi:hypothetical protein